jgi:hypothetical protein
LATPSLMWVVPTTWLLAVNPVIEDPGDKPISPEMIVGPVLVIVELAKRANVEHVPRVGGNVKELMTKEQ